MTGFMNFQAIVEGRTLLLALVRQNTKFVGKLSADVTYDSWQLT